MGKRTRHDGSAREGEEPAATIPGRVSLAWAPAVARSEFTPGPGTARISLAWWDPSELEGKRDPIIVRTPGGLRTLVVVWPTDTEGRILVEEIRAGQVEVLPWVVEPHLNRLQELSAAWPLDRHDLLVDPDGSVWPEFKTLRSVPLPFDLDSRVEVAARLLSAGVRLEQGLRPVTVPTPRPEGPARGPAREKSVSAIKHEEACARLGVSRDTMRALMADTPEDYDRPWVNLGSPERPVYRWRPGRDDDELWLWVKAVERERTSSGAKAVRSRRRKTPAAP